MNLNNSTVTNIIAVGSLIVAAITFYFYFRDRRKDKLQIKIDYQKNLLDWYSKTIELLIVLRCNAVAQNREMHLCVLSSQIEIGRFYFPNITENNNYGRQKPLAYQGYRNLALDFLVYSYELLKQENFQNHMEELTVFQREFTSIVFSIINPSENLAEIKKLTNKFFADERIFEDYLATLDENQLRAIMRQLF